MEPSDEDYGKITCNRCGEIWKLYEDLDGPMKCPKCGKIQPVKIRGTQIYLSVKWLGKELGKFSWCSHCDNYTLNIPGSTYSGKPLLDRTFGPESRYHPNYKSLDAKWREVARDENKSQKEKWDWYEENLGVLPKVEPTIEQLSARFFACQFCRAEKFWMWSYTCDRCDHDEHYLLETTEPVPNQGAAMEFGGNPMDWEELWLCRGCGYKYWVSNSNF
jgi:hypothetical protein